MAVAGDLDSSEDKTVHQVAALQLVSSFVLQNSVTGLKRKAREGHRYSLHYTHARAINNCAVTPI